MPSAIDPTKPTSSNPTTESVRDNFQSAADEISALQIRTAHSLAPFFIKTDPIHDLYFSPITSIPSSMTPSNTTANKAIFVPFSLSGDYLLDEVSVYNSTSAAGSRYIGIYSNDDTLGYSTPSALITDFPAISTSISNKRTVNCTPVQLTAGEIYWLAHVIDIIYFTSHFIVASLRTSLGFDIENNVSVTSLRYTLAGSLPSSVLNVEWELSGTAIPAVLFPIKSDS